MQPRSLEDRVTLREKSLQGLPERVGSLETRVTELTSEFVQFRVEVRAECSATRRELRAEIRAGDAALHEKFDGRIDDLSVGLRAEMHALHDRALEEMHALHRLAVSETQKLVEHSLERSMSQARTLHAEAMSRIQLIDRG